MEEQTQINEEQKPRLKPLPLPLIVIILLGIIIILIMAAVKVALEERNFVNKCNDHWLKQIEIAYPITTYPFANFNKSPTGISAAIIKLQP